MLDHAPVQLWVDEEKKILIFSRQNSIFAFNFNPDASFDNVSFGAPEGEYELAFSTDDPEFGGFSRLQPAERHITVNGSLSLYLPCRSAAVLKKIK